MLVRVTAAAAIAALAMIAAASPAAAQYPSRGACDYYEFPPGTPEYRVCVERELEMRRLGRVPRDYSPQRLVADSERACTYYGVPPGTPRFERCVRREVELRTPQ